MGSPKASIEQEFVETAPSVNDNVHELRHKHKPKTPMERQIALNAARKIDPGVGRFSWRAIQVSTLEMVSDVEHTRIIHPRCILSPWSFAAAPVTVVLMARSVPLDVVVDQLNVLKDVALQVMGGINSMEQYQRYFGLTGVGSKTS